MFSVLLNLRTETIVSSATAAPSCCIITIIPRWKESRTRGLAGLECRASLQIWRPLLVILEAAALFVPPAERILFNTYEVMNNSSRHKCCSVFVFCFFRCVTLWVSMVGGFLLILWLALLRSCSSSPSLPHFLLSGLARRVSIYLDRSKQGGECHFSPLFLLCSSSIHGAALYSWERVSCLFYFFY